MTYPIDHVDKGLSVAGLERIDHIGRFPVREDCLDERRELIAGNGAADQLLPCLLVGVESGGWIGEIVRMLCRTKMRRGLRRERATTAQGRSAGIDIHEHKVRRAFDEFEVVIRG